MNKNLRCSVCCTFLWHNNTYPELLLLLQFQSFLPTTNNKKCRLVFYQVRLFLSFIDEVNIFFRWQQRSERHRSWIVHCTGAFTLLSFHNSHGSQGRVGAMYLYSIYMVVIYVADVTLFWYWLFSLSI